MPDSNGSFDFIVVGAGVAGLAFALEAVERGFSVAVFERDSEVGGLSRTLEYKGYRFDYSAHRFHSSNPNVLARVKDVMGSDFSRYSQRSRILMFGRWLKYPFELQNLLRAMPAKDAFLSGTDFLLSMIQRALSGSKSAKFTNYRAWFEWHFGRRLYKVMCEPYTRKIWKTEPGLISADWADQRFQGVNIRKLIARVVRKIIRLDFSSYSLEEENLTPDGGEFYYASRGAQEMPNRYVARIESLGGIVKTRAKVTGIDTGAKRVHVGPDTVSYRRAVISTMSLHDLSGALLPKKEETTKDLSELKYMNIIFVYLMLDKDAVSQDHWLYFPDPDIIFNRSVEFKSWSSKMAPPGKTALCLDITCFESDEIWRQSKEWLIEQSISGAIKAGLIARSDVQDTLVIRVRDAYPFYDLEYRRKVEHIVRVLQDSGDLFCLGRTGIFQYNNADGSIEMAMELANQLCSADWKPKQMDDGLLGYKFRHISY